MKKIVLIGTFIATACFFTGCRTEADVASSNMSDEADNFGVERRIVFYNGITNEYILTIEGRCSLKDEGNQLEVTCKTGDSTYKKHFLGLSDNVSYVAEQIDANKVSGFNYRVNFRPETIIPDIKLRTTANAVVPNIDKVSH